MSKPRKYGMATRYNPKLWRGQNDRKRKPRPREKVTPKPVTTTHHCGGDHAGSLGWQKENLEEMQ